MLATLLSLYFSMISFTKASDAEAAAGTNNMRQQSGSNQPIRDLNGALLTCNEDQIRRWKEHFEATRNFASSSDDIIKETNASSSSKISITCPILAEIKDAIKTLKVNKADRDINCRPANVSGNSPSSHYCRLGKWRVNSVLDERLSCLRKAICATAAIGVE